MVGDIPARSLSSSIKGKRTTCDSEYAKCEDTRRSMSGRINALGGMITNWSSKKQATVALSSTKAEYTAYAEYCQEVTFTNMLLEELTNLPKAMA
jgi:hypothetical protein